MDTVLPPKVTEDELIARATAPRVSRIEIETILNEGSLVYDHTYHPLTLCVFRHPNGFFLVGHSAPASPENFDKGIGERLALEKVVAELWPLEGFLLRQKLADKEALERFQARFASAASIVTPQQDAPAEPPKPGTPAEEEGPTVPPEEPKAEPFVPEPDAPEEDDEDEEAVEDELAELEELAQRRDYAKDSPAP